MTGIWRIGTYASDALKYGKRSILPLFGELGGGHEELRMRQVRREQDAAASAEKFGNCNKSTTMKRDAAEAGLVVAAISL
jgi:hypothetical protein